LLEKAMAEATLMFHILLEVVAVNSSSSSEYLLVKGVVVSSSISNEYYLVRRSRC
jgi:hypothetical protein